MLPGCFASILYVSNNLATVPYRYRRFLSAFLHSFVGRQLLLDFDSQDIPCSVPEQIFCGRVLSLATNISAVLTDASPPYSSCLSKIYVVPKMRTFCITPPFFWFINLTLILKGGFLIQEQTGEILPMRFSLAMYCMI